MYEELVKRLRICPDYNEGCVKCPHKHDLGCRSTTMREAADAIEELSKLTDAIPHVCECCVGCELEKKNGGCDHAFVLSPKRAIQYLIKPNWIPVREQLPNDRREVQVTVFWHDVLRTLYGYYDGAYWHIYAPMHSMDMPTNYDRCMIIFPYRRVTTEIDGDDFFADYPELVEVADMYVIGWMEKPTPMPWPDAQKEEE